jgi:hypothetical protein
MLKAVGSGNANLVRQQSQSIRRRYQWIPRIQPKLSILARLLVQDARG